MNVGAFHSSDVRNMVAVFWGEGLSQREIARRIGKHKNVVAGLVHRMKLPKRTTGPRGWTAKRINDAKPKPKIEIQPIGPINDIPPKGTCRFIHGNPGTGEDWRMCGHPGHPWCEHHAAKVYNPRKYEPVSA